MVQGHTVKAFDDDITRLRGLVAQLGGLAEQGLRDAMVALASGREDLARDVIARDKQLDALEVEIDKLAIRTIALRAPMADDLREIIAALKISGMLERIGDYAKNIARSASRIPDRKSLPPLSLMPGMGDAAAAMVHDVLTAYAARNAQEAAEIVARDDVVDAFYDSLLHGLVDLMREQPETISAAAELLFVARNLERVGDHASSIAEMVHFAATGAYLLHEQDPG